MLRLSQCKEDLAARKVKCLSPLGCDFAVMLVGDHTIDSGEPRKKPGPTFHEILVG